MTDTERFFWFIGLFEGEGSFSMYKGYAKRITITSTDRDVLERVVELYGGIIVTPKLRNEKWKQEYVWYVNKEKSKQITEDMFPYLSNRRLSRAIEWLELCNENLDKYKNKKDAFIEKVGIITNLRSQGLTQAKIAEMVGIERSYVSKILKNNQV